MPWLHTKAPLSSTKHPDFYPSLIQTGHQRNPDVHRDGPDERLDRYGIMPV